MIRETRESGNSRRWKFSSIGCTSILVNSTPTALKRAKGLGAKVGGVLNPTTGIECHAKAQSRKAKALRMVACSASGRAGFAARLFASLRLCVAPSSTISKFRFNCAGWRGGSYALVVSPSPTAHRARLETPPTLAPRVFHEPTERWVVFRASCAQSTPCTAPNGKLATRFQGGGPPSLPVPPLRGFGFFWAIRGFASLHPRLLLWCRSAAYSPVVPPPADWHLHFTPTHACWLNQMERFFAKITTEAIRRGNFLSVAALVSTIKAYLNAHNGSPKPFVWITSADQILKKTAKLCKARG